MTAPAPSNDTLLVMVPVTGLHHSMGHYSGVSNGPVEAINGRLEHLRGIAQGFRNLDHYILRSLLHSGQLAERVNAL